MPSNKAPKQTKKKIADKVVSPSQEGKKTAGEGTTTSRAKKPSTAKKPEMAKTAPVKRHRKATPVAIVEPVTATRQVRMEDAMQAAPSETSHERPTDYEPTEQERVEQETAKDESPEPVVPREATDEEISELAYSYWVERGHQGGSPEEDWLRAERVLRGE